jgi:hypothetical protein
LHPNDTFACIVDNVFANVHKCIVPVPSGSNFIAVRVAQSDFLANSVTVRFLDESGAAVAEKPVTECGAASPFVGTSGLKSECNTYQTFRSKYCAVTE